MEKRHRIEPRVEIGVGGVLLCVCRIGKSQVISGHGFEKQIGVFGNDVFFIGRNRLFAFGGFGKFLHEVTLSVTAHDGDFAVDAEFVFDVLIIGDVLENREDWFYQHQQADKEYDFFHVANLRNGK